MRIKNIARQLSSAPCSDSGKTAVVVGSALLALCTGVGARAADVDVSGWACESCPFDSGYRAEYSAGAAHVSDDAAKFGDATGYNDKGFYALLDGDGIYTTDDHRLAWVLERLGLDSRSASLNGGKPGTFDYYFDYQQLPHFIYDTTATVFTGSGNSLLTKPGNWVDSGLTSGFTALPGSLQSRSIENERQTVALGGRFQRGTSPFRFTADYRHQQRDGNQIIGGSFYTQSALLPAAVDYQTDDFDLDVRYVGTNGHIRIGYHAGWFRNNAWAVTWDNPFSAPAAASRGRLAREPDNQYQNISLSGAYRFDRYNTVVSASSVFGQMEQNDDLLPYTINPDLVGTPLPRERLGGSVDTSHVALSLVSRPHRRARVRLGWTYDERDNQTPREQWQGVILDSFDSGRLESNVPYSYERQKLNARTTFDVINRVRLSAGYERTDTDREFQEVAEQTEDDTWAQLQWRPRQLWQVRVKGGTAKRTIDRYNTQAPVALDQNPLLRKYNLAYRFREYGSLTASATLPNAPITLSASVRASDDSFTQSLLGLQSNDELNYNADIDWLVNDRTTLYLGAGWDQMDATQSGSELFGQPDWTAQHEDDFFTTTAGLIIKGISDNIDLLLDYTHTDGDSRITLDSTNSGLSAFPKLQSSLDSVRLRLVYKKSERLKATALIRYEDFHTTDWALTAPDTIPTVLTLGADPYDYSVFLIGLQFSYSIGERSISLPE